MSVHGNDGATGDVNGVAEDSADRNNEHEHEHSIENEKCTNDLSNKNPCENNGKKTKENPDKNDTGIEENTDINSSENETGTSKNTDESPSENGTETAEGDEGMVELIKQFTPYLPTAAAKTLLVQRLLTLGIKNLSDLSFVTDMAKDFEGVLKPIQCRRLEAALSIEKAESNESIGRTYHLDVNNIFSKTFMAKLKASQNLSNSDHLKFVRRVADDIYDHIRPVTKKLCRSISTNLIQRFPGALGFFEDDDQVPIDKLAEQIQAHTSYMKKLDNKRKSCDDDVDEETKTLKKFSMRENFGINEDTDLPNCLPEDETRSSQKEKQNQMIGMAETGEINMPLVTQLMVKTYASQRVSIAEGVNMEDMIKLWPFIGYFSILKEHFFTLMPDINQVDIGKNLDEILPKMLHFLRADTNKTRTGNAGVATKNIIKILKKFDMQQSTKNLRRITMILCLGERMQQDMTKLFIFFEETTSFDEVQASSQLPDNGKPIVAVLGSDLMRNPKCYVIIEKRCISPERISPFRAVILAFMAYFVFKITYPQELFGLLEFFQRTIYKIKEDSSSKSNSRVERRMSPKGVLSKNPPAISPKYRTLMKDFHSYCTLWSL